MAVSTVVSFRFGPLTHIEPELPGSLLQFAHIDASSTQPVQVVEEPVETVLQVVGQSTLGNTWWLRH